MMELHLLYHQNFLLKMSNPMRDFKLYCSVSHSFVLLPAKAQGRGLYEYGNMTISMIVKFTAPLLRSNMN